MTFPPLLAVVGGILAAVIAVALIGAVVLFVWVKIASADPMDNRE
jgi:hypothetical protein